MTYQLAPIVFVYIPSRPTSPVMITMKNNKNYFSFVELFVFLANIFDSKCAETCHRYVFEAKPENWRKFLAPDRGKNFWSIYLFYRPASLLK